MSSSRMKLIVGLLAFLALDSFILCMASSKLKIHRYNFVLREKNFTRRCYNKSMLVVNGKFPGPVINVTKGDLVYVHVHNKGNYGVTIHWHGVRQPRNPWHDGPENITQCPIQPGKSFRYKVILSDEEGTLWWHAHSDWTRATVHGAFVINPVNGTTRPFPQPYKEEIFVLGVWYNGDPNQIIDAALATGADPNTSNGHTINGYTGNTTNCSSEKIFNMTVEYGKTYLLRIINAVMNDETLFGIANHNLTVVGTDAAYVEQFTTDYVYITPGQTIDVLLNASQTPGEYYIVGKTYFDNFATFDNTSSKAILKYEGNYSTNSSSIPEPTLPAYNDSTAITNFTAKVKSYSNVSVPQNFTKQFFMTTSMNILPCSNTSGTCDGPLDEMSAASLNNISFVTPELDILQAYYGNDSGVYNETFPPAPYLFNFTGDVTNISWYAITGTSVINLTYGDAVEIVWQNTAVQNPENHPMHLHGYSFYLVGFGSGNWNKSLRESYNLVNPPLRNTIGIPQKGWAAIRFIADNPGVWFMHCHFDRHASWGMETALVVSNGPNKTTKMLPPPKDMPKCSSSSSSLISTLVDTFFLDYDA